MKKIVRFLLILPVILFLSKTQACLSQDVNFPEAPTGFKNKKEVTGSKFMIAAANPLAVKAGYKIIKNGGNALDAALTAQLVLNIVEPQSSGIGGGAFILFWDNKKKKLFGYDGRETAPASATPELFLSNTGEAIKRSDAMIGGKSVGVPGLISVMDLAHRKHGSIKWQQLFQPAIKIAQKGFLISPRLNELLNINKRLREMRNASSHYYDLNGSPLETGTLLKSPQIAKSFSIISQKGIEGFYKGKIAENIVTSVTQASQNPSSITLKDISNYRAKERDPICSSYRKFLICGMPAPTSGGIGVIQTLGILENFNLRDLQPWSSRSIHLFVEASRLVYADRAVFIADPDFIPIPEAQLISRKYTKERSKLINPEKRMSKVKEGAIKNITHIQSPGKSFELPSTTHISVIDSEGNAVSMTSSIEGAFGSHLMVDGFFLNNQLTDFSYSEISKGMIVANQVEPGKRPRSSMAPIIVFDENKELIAVLGSPGGPAIVPLVVKILIAMLDWNMSPQEATNLRQERRWS